MARLFIIVALLGSPLFAVTPAFKKPIAHSVEMESAKVHLHITEDELGATAEVTCKFVIHNAGDSINLRLALPQTAIPEEQRDAFELVSEPALSDRKLEDGSYTWLIVMAPDDRLAVSWTWQARPVRLMNEHPLGIFMVRVPLTYVTGYSKLPKKLDASVTWQGLENERFGQTEDKTSDISVEVGNQMESVEYRFHATTLAEKRSALKKRLTGFTKTQRVATNRSYTETLVLLAEVLELAGDTDELTEIFASLADLETAAGHAITHCGPAAKWRKYVPWRLRHASLAESKPAAEKAKAMMSTRWDAYLSARNYTRPFDHFDAAKYGNYWDYDWPKTRDLYVQALDTLGESAAAKAIRETEVDEE